MRCSVDLGASAVSDSRDSVHDILVGEPKVPGQATHRSLWAERRSSEIQPNQWQANNCRWY